MEVIGKMNSDEFEYFIANEKIVVGVIKEDFDSVEFLVIKSEAYPQGMQGALDKISMENELKSGISVKLDTFEEASDFDMEAHRDKNLR